ncbi:hypothetical protein HDU87_006085 [Geranomyces variabilis]|uniref:Ketoreductase domain-containing protein n=1 Tax=Geranomyces variabilis TaxID=109894 RepID=A0AAD5TIC1_9FUNG|nr:hypothetical protein HDU87_006085 [Geranomyces variabilis]
MSVVVLNGASRGIGLALARHFLANTQLSVVTTARNPPNNAEEPDDDGRRWTHLSTDLTNEQSVKATASAIKTKFGAHSIAAVVNVAGYLHAAPEKSIAAITPENLHAHFAINVVAPALAAKHMAPLLLSRAASSSSPFTHVPIWANVSARVGSIGDNRLGGWYSYRMSKAAQNQLTKSLSIELGRRGGVASKQRDDAVVVVVALHPGTVRTDLSAPFIGNVAPEKLFTPDDAAAKLFAVLVGLKKEDNGRFLDYAGKDIVW